MTPNGLMESLFGPVEAGKHDAAMFKRVKTYLVN